MPAWVSSPVHREIVAALIEARRQRGMTQRDLAAALGKPPSFIGKIEAIERNVSVLEFVAWARAVEADPSALLPLGGEVPEL
ncbi:MAG: helix-turn-helix domain-containing protein [Brevundimonas sp.]|uniref:helix-turn-helix domain-containing protein n=1 Tax=Brevundimonas sp. TaxID=1871086 RepID=UPI003918C896